MSVMTEGEYRYHQLIKIFKSEPEPPFESAEQQAVVWGRTWGCGNDVGKLRVVLMHRPGDEVNIVDPTKRLPDVGAFGDPDAGWYWRGNEAPDLPVMQAQHDGLVKTLRAEGVEVVFVDKAAPGRMKTCFTRDSVIAVKGGAIVTRLGPPIRRGEELPITRTLAALGCPILRTIHGNAIMEGGSFAWIDEKTAVVGVSSRVNDAGADQLAEVLRWQGVELVRVYLTGYRLHIDGVFVMLDRDIAIVNQTQLPFVFLERLKAVGIRTVEVHHDDPVWTINCLAIAPGRVVMSPGHSPRTADQLDRLGIEIIPVPYDKMYSSGGGIHCSTAPLIRDPV